MGGMKGIKGIKGISPAPLEGGNRCFLFFLEGEDREGENLCFLARNDFFLEERDARYLVEWPTVIPTPLN
jgi:hypothetical protein